MCYSNKNWFKSGVCVFPSSENSGFHVGAGTEQCGQLFKGAFWNNPVCDTYTQPSQFLGAPWVIEDDFA